MLSQSFDADLGSVSKAYIEYLESLLIFLPNIAMASKGIITICQMSFCEQGKHDLSFWCNSQLLGPGISRPATACYQYSDERRALERPLRNTQNQS